jgi:hypothetical protein
MLFRRFHEDVLRCFGFKKLDGNPPMAGRPSGLNESGVSNKGGPSLHNNGSFVSDARDRSG